MEIPYLLNQFFLYKVLLTIKCDSFVAKAWGSLSSLFKIHEQCPCRKKHQKWRNNRNLQQWTFQHQSQSYFKGDIPINELRVVSYYPYELHLLYQLRVNFCMPVTSYFILHELWVTFFQANYELLFIAQVKELPFICDLRVSINCTKYGLLFNWVPKKINMIELLRWCYDKNYYLESLFDKDLGVR